MKNWMASGNSNKPMVHPIRIEDGSAEEVDRKKTKATSRLKANFDDFFASMPSVQSILRDSKDEIIADDIERKERQSIQRRIKFFLLSQ